MLPILVILLAVLFLSDPVRVLRGIRAVLVSVDGVDVKMRVAFNLDLGIELKHKSWWERIKSWGRSRTRLSGCARIATPSVVEA